MLSRWMCSACDSAASRLSASFQVTQVWAGQVMEGIRVSGMRECAQVGVSVGIGGDVLVIPLDLAGLGEVGLLCGVIGARCLGSFSSVSSE